MSIYLALGFRVDKVNNTFTTMKLMSGLAPPVGYSWICLGLPNGLDRYHDLDLRTRTGQGHGKAILLDFTGYAWVNCRKMEEHVWPVKSVREKNRQGIRARLALWTTDSNSRKRTARLHHLYREAKATDDLGQNGARRKRRPSSTTASPYYALISPTACSSPIRGLHPRTRTSTAPSCNAA
ncbi:MAG: hypothetical protein IPF78_15440 [Flavobacteriales bacterium]|nr:hypothetical protein [Flavobacteriales bacterium]